MNARLILSSMLTLAVAFPVQLVLNPSASAQVFTPPRFEALEQQKQALDQNNLDALQRKLAQERETALLPGPHGQPPGAGLAASALRQNALQTEIDRTRLATELERQSQTRADVATVSALPNRRVARASVLVVPDPVRFGLPPAPRGQYYARVDGRFVLVDGSSELVVRLIDPSPLDPKGDEPTPAPPPLQPLSATAPPTQ